MRFEERAQRIEHELREHATPSKRGAGLQKALPRRRANASTTQANTSGNEHARARCAVRIWSLGAGGSSAPDHFEQRRGGRHQTQQQQRRGQLRRRSCAKARCPRMLLQVAASSDSVIIDSQIVHVDQWYARRDLDRSRRGACAAGTTPSRRRRRSASTPSSCASARSFRSCACCSSRRGGDDLVRRYAADRRPRAAGAGAHRARRRAR